MAKEPKTGKMSPETQSARFIDAARELGCDESPDAFEAAVKKVARHKTVEETTNTSQGANHSTHNRK